MPAYVIFYVEAITDPQLLERYDTSARPVPQQAGGTGTVVDGRHEVLEGEPSAGVSWWNSQASMQRATGITPRLPRRLRHEKSAGKAHVVLVEGFAPPSSGTTPSSETNLAANPPGETPMSSTVS